MLPFGVGLAVAATVSTVPTDSGLVVILDSMSGVGPRGVVFYIAFVSFLSVYVGLVGIGTCVVTGRLATGFPAVSGN